MPIRLRKRLLTTGQLSLLESTSPFVLLAGGWGAGKSVALGFKALQLNRANCGLPGLWVAQTWGALFANNIDPWLERLKILPKMLWPKVVGRGSPEPIIRFPDGSKIWLGSAEHPGGYDGKNVAYMLGDGLEHWSLKAYQISASRVRLKKAKRAQRCYSANPKMNWMYDEFASGKEGRQLIRAPTRENARNLVSGYENDIRGSYSPRMQKAMLDGEFTTLEGAVYEQFDGKPESPWFVDFDPTPDRLARMPVHIAFDPGFRRPSCLFIALPRPDCGIVFDEINADGVSDMAMVEMINQRKYPIDEIWCDPAGDATQSAAAMDTFSSLRTVIPRPSNRCVLRSIVDQFRSVSWGVDKLRVMLGGYEGLPIRIHFARRLIAIERGKPRGIVRDLGSYKYPEEKDDKSVSDDPLKDGIHDHSCDALRYWAVGRWLTVPELRKKDPVILRAGRVGYETS
jgi:hypothetical protein